MAAGVLSMVNAKAGGVMYSKNPNNPESENIIINAVKGLGKLVVDGAVTAETYIVSRKPDISILEKKFQVNKTKCFYVKKKET